MTVKEFIEQNIDRNKETKLELHAKANREATEPFYKTVFFGMLSEIPQEYHDKEVLDGGYMVMSKKYCLDIYAPEEVRG